MWVPSISEAYKNRDDSGLVELINKFLDVQTKIIINNRGSIDKYMGDCIMAFWNAPLDCEDHADLAVKSKTLEVLDATKKLNEELAPLNLPPINVGMFGISTAECIVGNMGSELRFDYSVIGDAVNLGVLDSRPNTKLCWGGLVVIGKNLSLLSITNAILWKSIEYSSRVNQRRDEYTHR